MNSDERDHSSIGRIGRFKDLTFFEGIWRSASGSTYYARVVDGVLAVPYCYKGDSRLTGHYYDFKVVDGVLISRFKWFYRDISGYSLLRIEDDNKLVGGWWYEHDIPIDLVVDISNITESIPGMNKSDWTRSASTENIPLWVDKYFNEIQIKNGIVKYKDISG